MLDYGEVVVHCMFPFERTHYNLEGKYARALPVRSNPTRCHPDSISCWLLCGLVALSITDGQLCLIAGSCLHLPWMGLRLTGSILACSNVVVPQSRPCCSFGGARIRARCLLQRLWEWQM